MKIAYLKIYTADLLAKSRRLTPEQIGNAILGVCELAFDNETPYQPKTEAEQALFDLLMTWKNESVSALKKKKIAGRIGGIKSQKLQKDLKKIMQLSDGSTACSGASSTCLKQTETETETETDNNTLLSELGSSQDKGNLKRPLPNCPNDTGTGTGTETGTEYTQEHFQLKAPKITKPRRELNDLQKFSREVVANFEPEVKTDDQKRIWFARNCRALSQILKFCGNDITLGIATINECLKFCEERKLTASYEAVVRRIPDYYAEAKKIMEKRNTYAR